MEFSPFWLTRITFSNMNPFTGADMFLVQNLVMLAAGAGLRLVLRKKLPARIWGAILVLGWAVPEIIADFAARTEMGPLLTALSITWGPRFLMAMLGFLLASLICRLLKKRPLA